MLNWPQVWIIVASYQNILQVKFKDLCILLDINIQSKMKKSRCEVDIFHCINMCKIMCLHVFSWQTNSLFIQ